MKTKTYYILFFLSFLLYACESEKNTTQQTIRCEIDQNVDFPIADILSEVLLYPLDVSDDFLVKEIDKVIIKDSIYYILDKGQKSIFSFSRNGTPLKKMCKIGGAPDEYIELHDFDINENGEIVALCTPDKVLFLDGDLETKNSIILNESYNFIYYGKEGLLLYNLSLLSH